MNITLLKNVNFKALIVLFVLFSSVNSTMATNCIDTPINHSKAVDDEDLLAPRFPFIIQNTNNYAVRVEIHPSSCYNGKNPTPQEGIKIIILQPLGKEGDYHKMELYRDQGSRCDGKYGYFHLFFSNSPFGKKTENRVSSFQLNNSGDVSAQDRGPKAYPGYLRPKQGRTYTYETYTTPTGDWEVVCMATSCNKSYERTSVRTESTTVKLNKTTETALSASVTAGVEYGSYSGESTLSASRKTTLSQSIKTSISKSHTEIEKSPGISNKDIVKFGIRGMFEYIVKVRHKGVEYTITTGYFTYMTANDIGVSPNWLPGSVKDSKRSSLYALKKAAGR